MYNGSACNYHGRLIWAAQYDDNIAFPAVDSNWEGCAGRRNGCQSTVLQYFKGNLVPLVTPLGSITLRPVKETGYFTLIVTDNHFYKGESSYFNRQNEQLSNLNWTKYSYDTIEDVKNGISKSDTSEGPKPEVKTPSGQTHFDCSDPSISPMSKLGDYGQEYRLEK
ncbi:hypothetical protein M983_3256 [Proteus myxofaciens ATCC 19692]|uniref:Uncharacterized protein n=1 Tax=Proteus myxofaciens ATCC 19692 TaxID=1354337 RepID=A0A198EZF3_9GAMM|nr:hypothetical protein M983_3256 [Proteus myxofaciens ATCC 19692]